MINNLLQFYRLPFRHKWLLVKAILLLPLIDLSLKMTDFKRTKQRMTRFMPQLNQSEKITESQLARAQGLSKIVAIAGGHGIMTTTCLRQSLAVWWLLARRGIASEIKIGVKKDNVDGFGAHAWVECAGEPLNNPEDIANHFPPFSEN